jgi:protease II
MEVNLKKTQIIIFEKRKTSKAKPIFTLGNEKISVVQEYCYLGIKLNHNGNFFLAIKQLSEKALHMRSVASEEGSTYTNLTPNLLLKFSTA